MRMTAPGISLVVLGVAPLDAQVVPTRAAIGGAAWQDSATYFAIVNRRFTDSLPDVVEVLRDR